MKTVILAGGLGTRLAEKTIDMPKPLIKIGKYPILVHIMNHYSKHGYKDFIICCGYKGYVINRYFKNLSYQIIKNSKESTTFLLKKKNWKVQCINTGIKTNTGGRLFKLKKILEKENNFFLTYGDGVSNVNLKNLLKSHLTNKKIATITAVKPPARFGVLKINKNKLISEFKEKFDNNEIWINGGFFVFNKNIFKFTKKNTDSLEQNILSNLVNKKSLSGYIHHGFWHPMDTMRDKIKLNELIKRNKAPWM